MPCKVPIISFHLQEGKLRLREVKYLAQGTIGAVSLGASHSKALDPSVLPTTGADTPGAGIAVVLHLGLEGEAAAVPSYWPGLSS